MEGKALGKCTGIKQESKAKILGKEREGKTQRAQRDPFSLRPLRFSFALFA
jgi:hypothetical protein